MEVLIFVRNKNCPGCTDPEELESGISFSCQVSCVLSKSEAGLSCSWSRITVMGTLRSTHFDQTRALDGTQHFRALGVCRARFVY